MKSRSIQYIFISILMVLSFSTLAEKEYSRVETLSIMIGRSYAYASESLKKSPDIYFALAVNKDIQQGIDELKRRIRIEVRLAQMRGDAKPRWSILGPRYEEVEKYIRIQKEMEKKFNFEYPEWKKYRLGISDYN